MRTLAIGDVHGCFSALRTLAAFVPFHESDLLITVGDYVDRGPDSRAVVDWLIERKRTGKLVALRGNHEVMMLAARTDLGAASEWLMYGAQATLASYSPFGDRGKLTDVPDAHWEFLEKATKSYFETESHFFVHANAYPQVPLAEQPDLMLYWEPFKSPEPHSSGKVMVCGHTPQKSGRPSSLGHAICIDTLAHGGGWLTCLDVASGEYWQASQEGKCRKDRLPTR